MKPALAFLFSAISLAGCGPSSSPAEPAAEVTVDETTTDEASPPSTPKELAVSTPDFDALWNFGDPAATHGKFTALLEANAEAPLPWRLELRTQVARTHSLRKEFDAAHVLLDAVDSEVGASKDGGLDRVRIRSLLERGRCWNSAGDKAKARPLFEEAWELGRSAKQDGLAVDAAHMVAIAAMGTDDELAWGLKGLELAESSTQPDGRRWRGSLYNNLGWTFHDKGEFPKALELFDKQIEVRREAAKEPALRIARWARTRCLRSLERNDEALGELRAIVEAYGDDALKDGFVHEELAENLLVLGQADEAKAAFAEAHTRLKDSWLKDHEPERLARLAKLAE
ncbi:MAG: tetratricopeptide repeat protein [Deltaproteobacteria bacterium]|nr:tetratricopeptide repeat protein [Deltaproteobacteria bacterium]